MAQNSDKKNTHDIINLSSPKYSTNYVSDDEESEFKLHMESSDTDTSEGGSIPSPQQAPKRPRSESEMEESLFIKKPKLASPPPLTEDDAQRGATPRDEATQSSSQTEATKVVTRAPKRPRSESESEMEEPLLIKEPKLDSTPPLTEGEAQVEESSQGTTTELTQETKKIPRSKSTLEKLLLIPTLDNMGTKEDVQTYSTGRSTMSSSQKDPTQQFEQVPKLVSISKHPNPAFAISLKKKAQRRLTKKAQRRLTKKAQRRDATPSGEATQSSQYKATIEESVSTRRQQLERITIASFN